ncbi:MAG: ATP-dependent helicase [Saprospiraceae bacterium]|nr:ATP-dependent helicase [Saprospiraceae bacterium]
MTVKPLLVQYPNRFQETLGIVQAIEKLHAQSFALEEVAVLFAQHRQVNSLVNLLEKKGIPYNVKQRVNILELPLIRNTRLLLEYIAAEYKQPYSGEHLLFQLLHADFLQFDPRDIATIAQYHAKSERENRPFWRNTIERIEELYPQFSYPLYKLPVIQQFANFINLLIADYRNLSVVMLFERVVNRSGLLKFILAHEEKAWHTQILSTFFNFIQEEAYRNPKLNLQDLLKTFKNMEDNRLRLEINKTIVAAQGVNLLTAHSAKGLEFEKVFYSTV